jgi:hypothetical protein
VAASLAAALDEADLLIRSFGFAESLLALRSENLEPALAVFDGKRAGTSQHEVRVFMSAWSRFDPAAALAWAGKDKTGWAETLEGAALYAWGFRDPAGAVTAFGALDPARQRKLHWHLVEGWARGDDKSGVTAYVMNLPPNRARGKFIKMVAENVRKDGMDALLSWGEAVSESVPNDGKLYAVQSALQIVAKFDIGKATDWFERHQQSESVKPAIKVIATGWVDFHDPPQLFEWLVGLPPDETRDGGFRQGFVRWLRVDPDAAKAWLRGSTLTAAFDPAIAVYARDLSRASPAEAVDWAERIGDETLRRQTLLPILRQWAQEDHPAMREWLAESDVPEAVRTEILSSITIRIQEAKEREAAAQ